MKSNILARLNFRYFYKDKMQYINSLVALFFHKRFIMTHDVEYIMQATGIYDKEFNLLYENDIIEIAYMDIKHNYILKWDSFYLGFIFIDIEDLNYKLTLSQLEFFLDLENDKLICQHITVLGNLFQNKDLITDTEVLLNLYQYKVSNNTLELKEF